jgi:hypothetical protein
MATIKYLYSSETTITCGADGLANTSSRASTAVDNTTNLYVDALVSGQVKTAAGALGSNPVVYLYAYGWSYGQASDYTDNVTGSDANFTLPSPTNLKLIGVAPYTVSANTTLYIGPFSVALAFGGILPGKWGIVVNNVTGLSLAGSANQQTSNTFSFVGVNYQQ